MTTDTIVDANNKPLILKDMVASFNEMLVNSSAKFERDLAISSAKFEKELEKWQEKWDKGMQELKNSQAKTDKIVKANAKQLGGIGNSNGDAAQEFFYNSLNRTKALFGEKFDLVIEQESRKSIIGFEAEYDIIMFNGHYVCIVEVKYKADAKDIQKVLRKIITFRKNFPEHSDKKIFLALAGMSFQKNTEEACKDNGIAILKQVGDTIEVYDENLKTF